jgi:hypothetical protein
MPAALSEAHKELDRAADLAYRSQPYGIKAARYLQKHNTWNKNLQGFQNH